MSYEDLYRTNLITYNKIKNINKEFFAQYKLSSFFILNKKIIKESLFEVSNYNIYSNTITITITMTSGCIIICANPEDELSLVINNYYKSKVSIVSGKVCIISIY